MNRRQFIKRLGAVAGGASIYVQGIEPFWYQVNEHTLHLPNIPDHWNGRVIAQISDLHIGAATHFGYIQRVLRKVSERNPDLLVITGDLVNYTDVGTPEVLEPALKHLPQPKFGTVAILGNHDYGKKWKFHNAADEICRTCERSGVQMLRNQTTYLDGLGICGLDDLWAHRLDPKPVSKELALNRVHITLSHNPDSADFPFWTDYQGAILSGHTHGGQIRPPLIGPPILPVHNREYIAGFYHQPNKRQLYVNRGLGGNFTARLNARPEVTFFVLSKSQPTRGDA